MTTSESSPISKDILEQRKLYKNVTKLVRGTKKILHKVIEVTNVFENDYESGESDYEIIDDNHEQIKCDNVDDGNKICILFWLC